MSGRLPVSVPSPDKPPLFGVPPSIDLNVSARPGHSGAVVGGHDPRRYRLGGRDLRYRQRRHAVGEWFVVEVKFETGRNSASSLWLCSFYGTQDSLSIPEHRTRPPRRRIRSVLDDRISAHRVEL